MFNRGDPSLVHMLLYVFADFLGLNCNIIRLKIICQLIFGTSKIQFLSLEDGLPKRVKFFNPKSDSDNVLMISYDGLC